MDKSRAVYAILLVVAIAIVAGSLTNWWINIVPQYLHIDHARMSIYKAQDALTPEERTARINEAVQFYRKGPNLGKLQLLMSNSTKEEFGKVESLLGTELLGHTFAVRFIGTAIFEIIFLYTTLKGTVSYHAMRWRWGELKRYILVFMTFISFLFVLLAFVL